jgi:hypothetical protein
MTGSTVLNNRLRNSQSKEFDPIMMKRTQSFRGSQSVDDNSIVCSPDEDTSIREETREIVNEFRPHDEDHGIYETDSIEHVSHIKDYDPIMVTRTMSFRDACAKSMDDNSIVCSTDEDTSAMEETRDTVDDVRHHNEVRAICETHSTGDISQSKEYDPVMMTRTHSFRDCKSMDDNSIDYDPIMMTRTMSFRDTGTKCMDDNSIVCSTDEDTSAIEEIRDNVDDVRPHNEVRAIYETHSSSKDAVEVFLTDEAGSIALLAGHNEESRLVVPRIDESKRTKDEPQAVKFFSRTVEAMLGDEPIPELYASASNENDSLSENSSF